MSQGFRRGRGGIGWRASSVTGYSQTTPSVRGRRDGARVLMANSNQLPAQLTQEQTPSFQARGILELIAFLAMIEQIETELSFHHNLILAKEVSLQGP